MNNGNGGNRKVEENVHKSSSCYDCRQQTQKGRNVFGISFFAPTSNDDVHWQTGRSRWFSSQLLVEKKEDSRALAHKIGTARLQVHQGGESKRKMIDRATTNGRLTTTETSNTTRRRDLLTEPLENVRQSPGRRSTHRYIGFIPTLAILVLSFKPGKHCPDSPSRRYLFLCGC